MMHKHKITKIMNKLGSSSGESISETLVALLISALALVMLAGVIATSSRIVRKSRESMESYYDNCNEMVLMCFRHYFYLLLGYFCRRVF